MNKSFPTLTSAPSAYTDPEEIIKFIAEHFWDKYLKDYSEYPTDSTMLLGVANQDVDMAMGSFATLLETRLSVKDAQQAMKVFFDRIEYEEVEDSSSEVFERLVELTKKYFYDPNSPVRNEDIYLPFVKRLSTSTVVDEDMRPAYGFDAQMCELNQYGTKAADFSFKDLKGKTRSLYSIKSDATLLFFSNPGCPACSEIIDALVARQNISSAIESGKLAVVNIYIDRDIQEWKEYAVNYPSSWISGYDHKYTIRTDTSYNVRAIPSMYILDQDKKVIMKDAPTEKVLAWLSSFTKNN
ncbi:MAG: DUF5106 domain-containing protein [Bacteroidales bacterium]|nr:DUF5106 domain-containing protein [Bacteroidales bacterium]